MSGLEKFRVKFDFDDEAGMERSCWRFWPELFEAVVVGGGGVGGGVVYTDWVALVSGWTVN